jgi:hypothetical protein
MVGTEFDDKKPLIPIKATKSPPNPFIVWGRGRVGAYYDWCINS